MSNERVIKNIKDALSYLRDVETLDGQDDDRLSLAEHFLHRALKELEEYG